MKDSEILSGLQEVFINLGADEKQAATMSQQLLKRAQQKAAEDEIAPEQALEKLLRKAIDGRLGTFSG